MCTVRGVAPCYIDLLTTALEQTECERPYDRDIDGRDSNGRRTPNDDQSAAIDALADEDGMVTCWECQLPTASPIPDHQPPLVLSTHRRVSRRRSNAGCSRVDGHRENPPDPPDETPWFRAPLPFVF